MGKSVHLDDLELKDGSESIEIVTMWESTVLDVAHVDRAGRFAIGELLGTECPDLVAAGVLAVPLTGEGELLSAGRSQPIAGGHEVVLERSARAHVRIGRFSFLVSAVAPGRMIAGGWMTLDRRSAGYLVGSAALHLALLLLIWIMPPDAYSLSLDARESGSRFPHASLEPPETRTDDVPKWFPETRPVEDEGGRGTRHDGPEGQLGDRSAAKTRDRYGIQGPRDTVEPHMAREAAREQAAHAGILGILRSMSGSWNAPTSPFGSRTPSGNDPENSLGALVGNQVGPNFGYGGLEVSGTGRGGGGTAAGAICLGEIRTIGHGGGGGSGMGYGHGAGGLRGRDGAGAPGRIESSASVKGALSKEVIRRVVRQHMNEVKFCYEQQLAARPDLRGRVPVTFVISPSGAVQSATVAGSTLGNAAAEQCIARAVRRWTFPTPDGGGIVAVTYPLIFTSVDEGVEEQ